MVYNDKNLVFRVNAFLGADEKKMHTNIQDAIDEKPWTDPGDIFVSWIVDGKTGGAKVKDCIVID